MTALALIVALTVVLWRRHLPIIVYWIGALYFLSFAANLINNLLFVFKLSPFINLPGSFYGIAAIVIMGKVYVDALPEWKWIIGGLSGSAAAFAVHNLLFIQQTGSNSYSYALNAFLILGYAVFYFYWLMRNMPAVQIQRIPMFWFNTAFLINQSGTIMLFIFKGHLDENSWEVLAIFWIFHNSLSLLHMMLILVGLYYAHMETKQQTSANAIVH